MQTEPLQPFSTWAEVITYARTGGPLYYQAPLDPRPTQLFSVDLRGGIRAPYTYEARPRSIRIWPPGSIGSGRVRTSDPFTADAGHLSRFSRPYPAAVAVESLEGFPNIRERVRQERFEREVTPATRREAWVRTFLRDAMRRGHTPTTCELSFECAKCSASCALNPETGEVHGKLAAHPCA